MDANSLRLLEFHKIKERVKEFAQSNLGKELIDNMSPSLDPVRVRLLLGETTEARALVDSSAGSHPLSGLHDISESLDRVDKGGVLHPEDLVRVADVLRGASKVKKYMRTKRAIAPVLSSYSESITDLDAIVSEIDTAIAGNIVADSASPALARIRSQMRIVEERIKSTLASISTSARLRDAIQDGFISQKSGHWVVAIKASHKNALQGAIIATSNTGSTVFIEPESVRRHCEELRLLEGREEAEEYQVLVTLTSFVAEHLRQVRINLEVLGAYDFIFARARYGAALKAIEPIVADQPAIEIRAGRHPMLGSGAVPLNLEIGSSFRTLVITGPNTGGKTVVLKTAGLFCVMSQCGLHVPAEPGTRLGVFREVLADIGDAQSIENSLSTFSAHMSNISRMVKMAAPATLVLIDEIGTGTDPAEGAALACAVLLDIAAKGSVAIVTTHYGDVKRFADNRRGFVNGCMEFDAETLQPLYVLTIGKAGESNAFWIAQNLGFSTSILDTARKLVRRPETDGQIFENLDSGCPAEPDVSEAASNTTPVAHKKPAVRPPARYTAASRAAKLQSVASRPRDKQFLRGDCVYVHTLKTRGVVAEEEDELGNVVVRVRGNNVPISHKRLSMIGKREDIYPDLENYDLDIVLLSKDDRKLSHLLGRKLTGAVRVISPGKKNDG